MKCTILEGLAGGAQGQVWLDLPIGSDPTPLQTLHHAIAEQSNLYQVDWGTYELCDTDVEANTKPVQSDSDARELSTSSYLVVQKKKGGGGVAAVLQQALAGVGDDEEEEDEAIAALKSILEQKVKAKQAKKEQKQKKRKRAAAGEGEGSAEEA